MFTPGFVSCLLEAESEGILDDVDMTQVEKMILGPEAELESVARSGNVEEVEENRTKIKAKSEGILRDVNTTRAKILILGSEKSRKPKTEPMQEYFTWSI